MPGDGGVTNPSAGAAAQDPASQDDDGSGDAFEIPPDGYERISVRLPADKVERLRRIVWYSGGDVTLTGLVEHGIDLILQVYESAPAHLVHPTSKDLLRKAAGEPYPPREGAIRVGRPMGT